MPVTRPPVAQLYSLSQDLGAEVRDMQDPKAINTVRLRGRQAQPGQVAAGVPGRQGDPRPAVPDRRGGRARRHARRPPQGGRAARASTRSDPKVVAALEAYIAGGGVVLVSDDSKVQIKGATKLGAAVDVIAVRSDQQALDHRPEGVLTGSGRRRVSSRVPSRWPRR